MNKKLFIIITVLGMVFAGSAAAMKKETKISQDPSYRSPGNLGDRIVRVCPWAPYTDRRRPLNHQDPKVQAVRKRLFESDEEEVGDQE